MDSAQVSTANATQNRAAGPLPAARYFYSGASASLILFVIWGFHHFYLQGRAYPGRPLTPPIRTLIILHGTAMAAWMLLSVVQPFLIATRNRKLHMRLGWVGAGVAAAVVVLGFMLGVASVRVAPPEAMIWGVTPKQFMAVPIISIAIFAGFVFAGVLNRRRPAIHRTMMMLASLSAMSAAVSRIDALNTIYLGTVWERVFGPFFTTLLLAYIFLAVKSLLDRKLDRIFAFGCAGLTLASALIWMIGKTGAWDSFAGLLLGK